MNCLILMHKRGRDPVMEYKLVIKIKGLPQYRESREIFYETETMKMASRQDQFRNLESRLHSLIIIIETLPLWALSMT